MNNTLKITDKLPANYYTMTPDQQYQARLAIIKNVTNGTITLTCSGKGNARVYVLNGSGGIGETGTYLK